MAKRLLGIVLIAIALLLTLAIIGEIHLIFGVIAGIVKAVLGRLSAYELGKVLGTTIYWVIHFVLTFLLWSNGLRLIKKKSPIV